MRKQISKAISRRSKAIHTSLKKYNSLAMSQDPPRPKLNFADVVSYAMLADFDLLKHSRGDILNKPWSSPANRLITSKYFKVQRAHEEITRLNVEIHRLSTWVNNEDEQLKSVADNVIDKNEHLGLELQEWYYRRKRMNDDHRARLRLIFSLPGFIGDETAGIPLGHMDTSDAIPQIRSRLEHTEGTAIDWVDQEMEIAEDDVLNEQVLALGEFLENCDL